MKIRQSLTFRFISGFLSTVFTIQALVLCSPAYAEKACWNDGAITFAVGGSNIPTLALKGDPNPRGSEKVADPVNIATGNFYYEQTELVIPSRGMPLEFKRYYNGKDDYEGPFGIGTSHSYNAFLIEAADDEGAYVVRRNPSGNKDKFAKNADNTYTAPAGVFDTLTKDAQGYLITTKNGIKYRFNASGYLSSIADRNANQITLTYDTSTGVLIKITGTDGRDVLLEYTSDRKISKITDFSGRAWSYGYSSGDLVSAAKPATTDFPSGTTIAYTYTNHNIVSIADPKGNSYLNITYDDQDRVDKLTSGLDTTDFSYSQNLTTVYDGKGNKVDYVLNSDGTTNQKTEYSSGYSYVTKYEYNSDKLVTKIVYPRGNSVEYAYDAKGNLLTTKRHPISGSAEPDIVTNFAYEPSFNFVKTAVDPKGNTTTYYYDYEEATLGDLNGDGVTTETKGNLVKIILPSVSGQIPESRLTYNAFGQVATVIDPNGNIIKYDYDLATGYLTKTTLAQGALDIVTEMTYDAVGNVQTIKDPKGNTASFEYDSHNNLIKSTSPAPFNYVTKKKYDANDNLVQVDRQTNDIGNPWQTTYYTYDILDRLLTTKDPLGNITTFGYDANGNKNLVQDAELNSTISEYDSRNKLWKVTDAKGNITEYTYDANGNLKEIKDAKGNSTNYTYDDFDRLKTTTYAGLTTEECTYDSNSNLIIKKDPKNQIITYAYDALNRLDLKTYPDSKTVDYVYDKGSRLKQVIDETGTIAYDYDTANRVTKVTYPGSKSVSYEYEANSNRTKLIYPDSSYITYEYDQLNRLTAIKDQSSQAIASYTYDALSRRTKGALANGTETAYTYDYANRIQEALNRQTAVPTNKISQFDYTYDKVGNRKTMVTLSGAHTYTYDNIYQLTAVTYPSGYFAPNTTFNYDAVGNRDTVVTGSTTSYTANSLNQYTQVGAATYTNDDNGNLVNDGTWTYTYNYENRLTQAAKTGTTATYKYDPLGRRIEKTVNGTTTKFLYDGDQIIAEYDGADALISKFVYGAGIDEVVSLTKGANTYYYHYDGLGSVTNLTDSSGATTESYSYDVFGKPNTTSAIGNTRMFAGREYDSETGLYYNRARYYSPSLGRFLQRDPVGYSAGINLYSYCSNNSINFTDPSGLDKWSLSQLAKGVGTALLAIGIGTGVVLALPEALLASAIGTSLIWTLGIIGSASLGLNTGAVITGQTISGHSLSASERSYLAGNALVGWGTLGIGVAISNVASSSSSTSQAGTKVYRVWGDDAGPYGQSWTTVNPNGVSNFRSSAGLPDTNSGRFVSEGILNNANGVGTRGSLVIKQGQEGGLPEVIIPGAENQVTLTRVSGANPPF